MGSVARGSGNSVVIVVADGVSTATDSASASAATVEAVATALESPPEDVALTDAVRSAIDAANQAVLRLPSAGGGGDGPETTVVVALCRGSRVAVGWVGDSRAYFVGPDAAEQLTVDDSWVEEAIHTGEKTRTEAMLDERAHFVTQVLGMKDQPLDIHLVERELPEDSILLLCSDGLWNYFLETGELATALRQGSSSGNSLSACRYLVDAANERGGKDNVTVAMLDTHSPQSSSPEA
jgi:serine/threonine protein phosphatase PrpC